MCELCNILKIDRPFRFHRPDSKTKEVLIGKISNKYIDEFEKKIYSHAMNNSLMTAVIGNPGAGKTQLINYLESIPLSEKDRISLILELKDKRLDYDELINFICDNKSVKSYLKKHGHRIPLDEKPDKQIIYFKKAIEDIFNETENIDVGVCLLVDAVDEYLRKMKSFNGHSRSDIIKDLLGTFMILLAELPRLCVVFAVTENVYDELREELKEVSTGRRFKFVTDENGEPLKLERLDNDETLEMIAKYLEIWSQRNNVDLPLKKDTIACKNLNIYPFTVDALNLLWRAGVVPGDTCMGCLMVLHKKIVRSSHFENREHLIVTKFDAAWTIKEFSGYFVNYEKDGNLKQEIDSLLIGKEIDFELEKVVMKAMQNNSDYSSVIIDAFESYTLALSNDFNNFEGNKRSFVRSRFKIGTEFEILDLIIKYKSINIGLQFILTNSEREIRNKINALAMTLKNKQIEKGLIILVADNQEKKLNLIDKCMDDLKSKFEDFLYNLDYSPTIYKIAITENDAWCIVGLHELIKGDRHRMQTYCKHLEQNLHISSDFAELIQANPLQTENKIKGTTVGTLDKAE